MEKDEEGRRIKERYEWRIKGKMDARRETEGGENGTAEPTPEEEGEMNENDIADLFEVAGILGGEVWVQEEVEQKDTWRDVGRIYIR